jgi:hypothetical protein
METTTVVAFVLAVVSTTLVNLAYLREHEAVTSLPALRMRRPVESARVLLANRRWLFGFAMETPASSCTRSRWRWRRWRWCRASPRAESGCWRSSPRA